jgi:hypothetical protein
MLLGVGWDSSTKWAIGWSISIGYRHDLNKYLSCDENIIINLIPLQWIIFSGIKLLEPIFS